MIFMSENTKLDDGLLFIKLCWKYKKSIFVSLDMIGAVILTIILCLLIHFSNSSIATTLDSILKFAPTLFVGILGSTIVGFTLFFAIPKDDPNMRILIRINRQDFFLFVPFWIITWCCIGLSLTILYQLVKTSMSFVISIIPIDVYWLGLLACAIFIFMILYVILAFMMFCWSLVIEGLMYLSE